MLHRILLLIIFIFTFCPIKNLLAQESGELLSTRFLRPSLTYLYIAPGNHQERALINSMKELHIENMFNDHRIDFPFLANMPAYPSPPHSDASYEVRQNYNKRLREVTAQRRAMIDEHVIKATNPIVAKWFDRDEKGRFSTKLLAERGLFTATDTDAIESRAAQVDRRELLGLELIDKTYIIVWEIREIKTRAQLDRERGITNSTHEGYIVSYSAHVYNLVFNDSVSAVFWDKYWTDESNFNESKAQKWKNAVFPIKHVTTITGDVSSTQPIDPNSTAYLFSRKKTMNELLLDVPQLIIASADNSLGRMIPDFLPRAPVFDTRPISAKLGTKESLYFDQRFFIYELGLDKAGNKTKNRKGVARVRNIADNYSIATGDAEPSTFRQQGGRKIYMGMLIESARDFGTKLSVGYIEAPENKTLGGVGFNLDFRISRAMANIMKIGGLHFGIGGSFNLMNNVKPGIINMQSAEYEAVRLISNQELSGFNYNFWFNISKETYFTPRGNLFFNPTVGLGVSFYNFTSIDGQTLNNEISFENYEYNSDDWVWYSLLLPAHIGIGIHLSPTISLEVKPGIFKTFGYKTNSDNNLWSDNEGNNQEIDTNRGFGKIGESETYNSLLFNLVFRF